MVGQHLEFPVITSLLLGALAGGGGVWNLFRIRLATLDGELRQTRLDFGRLEERRKVESESLERQQRDQLELQAKISAQFTELSAKALRNNNEAFLTLARESLGRENDAAKNDLSRRQQAISETLTPVHKQLELLHKHIGELEKTRADAYGELRTQVKNLHEAQNKLLETSGSLKEETARLASSLRSTSVRGRWGELQLRNVVELSGMVEHCDFAAQPPLTADGTLLRPDLTVRLPTGHQIVVDAKAPLNAYLDALDATGEDERRSLLQQHANAIRGHCKALGSKAYWQRLEASPEFVVLFLPGEMFYSAALQVDHDLLDWSWSQNIILATPTMLIALLKTIAHGWRAAAIEKNAIEVSKIGGELYRSLGTMGEHIRKMAKNLGGSVDSFNDMIGSFERNVYTKARKFNDLKLVAGEIDLLPLLDAHPRSVTVREALTAEGPAEELPG